MYWLQQEAYRTLCAKQNKNNKKVTNIAQEYI